MVFRIENLAKVVKCFSLRGFPEAHHFLVRQVRHQTFVIIHGARPRTRRWRAWKTHGPPGTSVARALAWVHASRRPRRICGKAIRTRVSVSKAIVNGSTCARGRIALGYIGPAKAGQFAQIAVRKSIAECRRNIELLALLLRARFDASNGKISQIFGGGVR